MRAKKKITWLRVRQTDRAINDIFSSRILLRFQQIVLLNCFHCKVPAQKASKKKIMINKRTDLNLFLFEKCIWAKIGAAVRCTS